MTTQKVGVVIPIYNTEKYLKECLDSVIHQTYENLEILLINDGSTDSSLQIAKKYAQKDSRITIIDKANGGQASARNAGIRFLSGELLHTALSSRGSRADETIRVNNLNAFNGGFYDLLDTGCHADKLARNDKVVSPQKSNIIDCHINQSPHNERKVNVLESRNNVMTDTLHRYQIVGENPYQIHAIYSLKSSLEIPTIDYLQFVDSDDYIELHCVEQCVSRMRGVEIVWFDYQHKYEGNFNYQSARKPTTLQKYNFNEVCKITPIELFAKSITTQWKWYAFAWQGMIDFKFLKTIQLRFANVPLEEDHHFWLLLFAQSHLITILPQKLYFYRIHPHSITNYGGKTGMKNIPKQFQCCLKDFYGNPMLLHKYCLAGSAAVMLTDIFKQMENGKIESQTCAILKQSILNRLCMLAMNLESFQADPMGFLPLLNQIKPYAHKQKIGAYALVHQSLEYQLGLAILSSFKNIPNFLKSLGVVYQIFKQYKKLENIEHTNCLQTYWDFKEAEHLKKHLSFKIGKRCVRIIP